MIFKLCRQVLLPVPLSTLQNYTLKSMSESKGYVITIKKKYSRNKTNPRAARNLVDNDLFGPVVKMAPTKKRAKVKSTNSPVIDFHQTTNFYKKPLVFGDINQQEHGSNLNDGEIEYSSICNEITKFSLKDNKLNDFNAFNKKKYNKLYPQDGNIFNIRNFHDKSSKLPSVSKILQQTMSPERRRILQKWEANMIKELGEEGFRSYMQDILDRGKLFHKYVEQSLQNKIEGDFQNVEQYIKSTKSVLQEINSTKLLESRVIHPYLHYQGYVDCVGLYRGIPVVIDFKTSRKSKSKLSDTYDSPIQVAAYLGALNYDPSYDTLPNISSTLLVIAYETGVPADIHHLSEKQCLKYWGLWQKRLLQFKKMNSSTEQ